jgi:hypothetical protein
MFTRSIRPRPTEYCLLIEPRPDGPVVGHYAGKPIAAAVIDFSGSRYTYVGAAPRLSNGRYDVEALHSGEWIVEPGLVYYANPNRSTGPLFKLLRRG